MFRAATREKSLRAAAFLRKNSQFCHFFGENDFTKSYIYAIIYRYVCFALSLCKARRRGVAGVAKERCSA